MARLGVVILLPVLLFAQEGAAEAHPENLTYKWINFGILAAGILFLLVKYAFPLLNARRQAIGRDLAESKANVEAANAKAQSLSSKLNNFDSEIAGIRAQAVRERENEAKRIAEQTDMLLAKLHAQRENEILGATQIAQSQLRAFTAQRAIEIAQSRLAGDAGNEALVQAFLADLRQKQEAR